MDKIAIFKDANPGVAIGYTDNAYETIEVGPEFTDTEFIAKALKALYLHRYKILKEFRDKRRGM